MTITQFSRIFEKVYDMYYLKARTVRGINSTNYEKFIIIVKLKYKLLSWIDNDEIKEVPTKIKFDYSFKRKYIVAVFSELGFKVTRYSREYGKTIVHIESVDVTN